MHTVVIVIHLMIVVAMIGIVLLQRSEGGGLGIGSSGGFMSSRGTANVLSRTTAILAGAFFVTSLALSIIASISHRPATILRDTGAPTEPAAPGAPSPLGQPGGGVLDTLRGGGQPQAPAPSGPQVPRSQ